MDSKNFQKRSTRQKIYDDCKGKLTKDELYMVLFYNEPIANANKIWDTIYKLPVIEKDESFEDKFEDAPIGQKKTSKVKPLVFIFPKFVYKGPYNLKQTKAKLRNLLFRQDFLLLLGDDVPSPIKLYQITDTERIFIRMPHVGSSLGLSETKVWKTKTVDILGEQKQRQIVTKESQGIEEFLQYLKNGGKDTEIIYKALLHYIHRVICDPVIGDPALRNILIVDDDVICIDFEDNRGNIDYDLSIFEILGGKTSWATKNVLELFSRVLSLKKKKILRHLKNIDIEGIENLITQHQIADLVSIENIKDRIKKMTECVNGLDESELVDESKSMADVETQMFYKHNNSISRHGHTQDALISALQKYIRRGELKKAQYVGIELFLFNSIPEAKALVTRFINRLRVILPEDTSGIASPRLAILFNIYYTRTLKGVLSMIYLLVKSPKIRLISDIKMVFFSGVYEKARKYSYFDKIYPLKEIDAVYKLKKGDDPKLQKVANGIVTGIKKKSDNGFYWLAKLVDYVEEGIEAAPRTINKTRANNHPMYLAFEIYFEYANRGANLWDEDEPIVKDKLLIETLTICFNWYKDFGLKKKTTKSPKETSHRDWIVFVIWPAMYCFRKIDWNKNVPIDPNYSDEDVERIVNKLSKPIELDDYVFDKHTKKGKQMGRGAVHFAEEGALVVNEDTELLNKYYRRLYLDIRKET